MASSAGLSTQELERLLRPALQAYNVNFIGVLPRDKVPDLDQGWPLARYPAALVANADSSTEPGSHWLAMYMLTRNSVEFFDSFALPPSYYSLSLPSSTISVCSRALQSDTSSLCGHYCVYYLIRRAQGHSPLSITNAFSKFYLDWNDSQLANFCKRRLFLSVHHRHSMHNTSHCNQGCRPRSLCPHTPKA